MSAIEPFRCVHCGATRFQEDAEGLLHCSYCRSTYRRKADDAPRLVIAAGANVVIGRAARVRVDGDVRVEQGAYLEVQGELQLVSRAKPGTRR